MTDCSTIHRSYPRSRSLIASIAQNRSLRRGVYPNPTPDDALDTLRFPVKTRRKSIKQVQPTPIGTQVPDQQRPTAPPPLLKTPTPAPSRQNTRASTTPESNRTPSRQSTPAGTTPEPDGGFGDPEDPERMQDVIPSPPVTPHLSLSPSGLPIIGGVAPPYRQTSTSNAIVLFQPQTPTTSRFVNFPPTGTNIATIFFQPQTPARSGFINSSPTTTGSQIIDIRTPQSSPLRSLTRQTPRAIREIENRRKREEEPRRESTSAVAVDLRKRALRMRNKPNTACMSKEEISARLCNYRQSLDSTLPDLETLVDARHKHLKDLQAYLKPFRTEWHLSGSKEPALSLLFDK
jgi:hypothetical protein